MTKFKIGDRVKIIDIDGGADAAIIGYKGEIIRIINDSLGYLVKFDKPRNYYRCGYSFDDKTMRHECYWCSEKMLKRITEKKISIKLKGNKVIAKDSNGRVETLKCNDKNNFYDIAQTLLRKLSEDE